jgi:hypothetical protein
VLVLTETAADLPAPRYLPYQLCVEPWRLPRLLTLFSGSEEENAAALLARWQSAKTISVQDGPCNNPAAHLNRLATLTQGCFAFRPATDDPHGPDAGILDALSCSVLPLTDGVAPSDLLQSWLPPGALPPIPCPKPDLATARAHLAARRLVFEKLSAPDVLQNARAQFVDAFLARIFETPEHAG